MPSPPAKVCLVCGFDDCENITRPTDLVELGDQSQLIESAVQLLAKSESPLICGLSCLDSDAQMVAWKLADQVRAIVDTSLIDHGRAAIQAVQRHGKVTATYGEISSRSDVVVIWDCDLRPKHDCLLRMLCNDRVAGRKIVFVGAADSPMAQVADQVFSVDVTKERVEMIRLVCRLRAKVLGQTLHDEEFADGDLQSARVQDLFDVLRNARYGSLFYSEHEPDWEFDLLTESLLQLVGELNSITPFVGMKLRDDANGLGAESVLSLASGFPAAISLQRGQAASTGAVYSAAEILRRSACDTIVLLGNVNQSNSESVPAWLLDRLQRLTVIQLAPVSDSFADIFIACPTIEFGKAFAGKVLRGDGVMLSGANPTDDRSAAAVLRSLLTAFQENLDN